jgi:DNA-binding transcriptional LysR family regulator
MVVDRPLAQLGVKRSVLLTIPFFVPAIYAIAHSDLVLTIPRKLAKITRGIMGVRVVEPPRELKAFPYFMARHSRLTGETAHSWFREQIRQAVASL